MSFRNLLLATASLAASAICSPCQASTILSILTDAVDVYVGNSNGTPNPDGVAIFANFTPNLGLTLSQAAKDLGYIGFDWKQTITNWPDPNLRRFNDTLLTPVPSPNTPFLDPPLGGYNYNPCGGKAPGSSAAAANPFYFDPTGSSSDCWSLAANETSKTLSFADEPMDHELTSSDTGKGDIPKFATDLVGIKTGNILGPDLIQWTWETTYNGSVGGASRSANSPYLDPGTGGTGRVIITSISGVLVPEPSALFLLASGVLAMLTARKAAGRNRTRIHPDQGHDAGIGRE